MQACSGEKEQHISLSWSSRGGERERRCHVRGCNAVVGGNTVYVTDGTQGLGKIYSYDMAIDMWSKLPDCVYKNSSITVIMQLNPCTLHQWQIVEIRSRGVDNIASVRICISEWSPTALCFKVTVSKPQDNTTDTQSRSVDSNWNRWFTSWWIHVWGLSKSTIA